MEDSKIIYLNVGGRKYDTTLGTLNKFPGSMLANLFSGKYKQTLDSKGRVFIDRNGKTFEEVLEFLRSGKCDSSERVKDELLYFGLIEIPKLKFCGYIHLSLSSYRLNEPNDFIKITNRLAHDNYPGSRAITGGELDKRIFMDSLGVSEIVSTPNLAFIFITSGTQVFLSFPRGSSIYGEDGTYTITTATSLLREELCFACIRPE